jgi:hypothetical protein
LLEYSFSCFHGIANFETYNTAFITGHNRFRKLLTLTVHIRLVDVFWDTETFGTLALWQQAF